MSTSVAPGRGAVAGRPACCRSSVWRTRPRRAPRGGRAAERGADRRLGHTHPGARPPRHRLPLRSPPARGLLPRLPRRGDAPRPGGAARRVGRARPLLRRRRAPRRLLGVEAPPVGHGRRAARRGGGGRAGDGFRGAAPPPGRGGDGGLEHAPTRPAPRHAGGGAAVFLATEVSAYLSGWTLPVDGGGRL